MGAHTHVLIVLVPEIGVSGVKGKQAEICAQLAAKRHKNAAQGVPALGYGAGAASPEGAKEVGKGPFAPLVLVPKCGSAHAVRC